MLTDYEYYLIQYGDSYGRAILEVDDHITGYKYLWFGRRLGFWHRGDVLVFDKDGKYMNKIKITSYISRFLPYISLTLEDIALVIYEEIENIRSE